MRFNNIVINFGSRKLSIAQHHFSDGLSTNEVAIIDSVGVGEPIEFKPDLESLLSAIGRVLSEPQRESIK